MFSENSENNCVIKKISLPTQTRELVSDLSLPDYLPDVSRLLRTSASIGGESSFVGNGSAEYDGEISYTVIYATSDGRIKSVSLTSGFSGSASIPDDMTGCECEVSTCLDGVFCRLQNPRRLSLRCKLKVSCDLYSQRSAEPVISGKLSPEEEANVQKRFGECRTVKRICARDENVPVSEDVELEGHEAAVGELISVCLTPYIYESKAGMGTISYRGDVICEIIYLAANTSDDAEYTSVRRKIAIEGEVAADGVSEGFMVTACAGVSGVEYRTQANAFGENRTVEVDFSYTVQLTAFSNACVETVTDMYSTDYASKTEETSLESREAIRAASFNFSIDGAVPLDEKEYDRVVSSSAEAVIEETFVSGQKMVFAGSAEVSVILANGAGSYIGRTFKLPIRAESDIGREAHSAECLCTLSVLSVYARADGGEIRAEAELGITYCAFDTGECRAVGRCSVMKELPTKKALPSQITICYPSDEDDLWSIAKRYGSTERAVSAENDLGGGALGNVIVIPNESRKKTVF